MVFGPLFPSSKYIYSYKPNLGLHFWIPSPHYFISLSYPLQYPANAFTKVIQNTRLSTLTGRWEETSSVHLG